MAYPPTWPSTWTKIDQEATLLKGSFIPPLNVSDSASEKPNLPTGSSSSVLHCCAARETRDWDWLAQLGLWRRGIWKPWEFGR